MTRNPNLISKGRVKGSRNKMSSELKELIIEALHVAGECVADPDKRGDGVDYLVWLARTNSSAFASLLGKVLPMQVGGLDGQPIRVTGLPIEFVDAPPLKELSFDELQKLEK